MKVLITAEELQRWDPKLTPEQAEDLINDGVAMALTVAPCLADEDFPHVAAAKAIIRSACLRWGSSGNGGTASEQRTAGPYNYTTTFQQTPRRSLFYPSEITALQNLCKDGSNGAHSIDTLGMSRAGCPPECDYLLGSVGAACLRCARTCNPGVM